MPSQITKINILLISPSDVAEERKQITQIIQDWNAQIGKALNVIIEVLKWESHVLPELGKEPQKIVNQQIVKDADLGIAIFWSRLGTETSTHPSGSIEEIDELLKMNKKVLVYFCDRAFPQESYKKDQIDKLQAQKERLRSEGIVGNYHEIDDLKEKVLLNVTSVISNLISYNREGIADVSKKNSSVLEKPNLVIKSAIAIAKHPLLGTQPVLSIDVQNHSSQTVYLGLIFFKQDNREVTYIPQDTLTGESQKRRILNPGEKFNFNINPKELVDAVKPNKVINVAIKDEIDRVYEGNAGEIQSNLEALYNLKI